MICYSIKIKILKYKKKIIADYTNLKQIIKIDCSPI